MQSLVVLCWSLVTPSSDPLECLSCTLTRLMLEITTLVLLLLLIQISTPAQIRKSTLAESSYSTVKVYYETSAFLLPATTSPCTTLLTDVRCPQSLAKKGGAYQHYYYYYYYYFLLLRLLLLLILISTPAQIRKNTLAENGHGQIFPLSVRCSETLVKIDPSRNIRHQSSYVRKE